MKKSFVIDESIKEEVRQCLFAVDAFKHSIEHLSLAAEGANRKIWDIIFKQHPSVSGRPAALDNNSMVCTYEIEEGATATDDIDPIFLKVHTPPPLDS